jgi:hypothetical protein
VRASLVALSLVSLALSYWFWWPHLLAWIPAAIIYSLMLRELRSQSPILVVSAIPPNTRIGLSAEAITWLFKHGHAVIRWGAACKMGQHIRSLMTVAFLAIVLTAFRHSWWWLLELIACSAIMISLRDGFQPIKEEQIHANSTLAENALGVEIVPLLKQVIKMDLDKNNRLEAKDMIASTNQV